MLFVYLKSNIPYSPYFNLLFYNNTQPHMILCASDLVDYFYNWFKKYGDIFRLWFGTRPFVGIFSPEYAEVRMKTINYYYNLLC